MAWHFIALNYMVVLYIHITGLALKTFYFRAVIVVRFYDSCKNRWRFAQNVEIYTYVYMFVCIFVQVASITKATSTQFCGMPRGHVEHFMSFAMWQLVSTVVLSSQFKLGFYYKPITLKSGRKLISSLKLAKNKFFNYLELDFFSCKY